MIEKWMEGLPTISGTIAETGEKVKMIRTGYWIGARGAHITSYMRADGKDPDYQYSMDRHHRFWLEAVG